MRGCLRGAQSSDDGRSIVSESSEGIWVSACFKSGVRLWCLRRMQRREQTVWWMVKYGKNGIAKVLARDFCDLQSYCDALVDEMLNGEGCQSHIFFFLSFSLLRRLEIIK